MRNMEKSGFLASEKMKPVRTVLALIPALIAVVMAVYYIWGPGEGYFHADCTDSIYWAQASVESGKVFDPYFRYAGMLPFSVSMIFIPLIKIFGLGMTAQNIGMTLFSLIYVGSVIFVCRSAKAGWGWSSLAALVSVAAMSSSDKLRELMYGHNIYYTIGPVIVFIGVGLLLRASRNLFGSERTVRGTVLGSVQLALFLLLCLGSATDGSQIIVLGSLPALAGIVAERFFSGREPLLSRKNLMIPASGAVFCAGTLAGALLLKIWKGSIECGYAEAYSGWSEPSSWADNALAFVKQYFTLIGVAPKGSLFSPESVGTIVRILGGILLLAVPVVLFFFYSRLTEGTRVLLWSHSVVFFVVMFGFICGKLSGVNWRLTPVIASAAVLCVMAARELIRRPEAVPDESEDSGTESGGGEKTVPRRLGAVLVSFLVLFSALIILEVMKMPADYGRDNYRHSLASFLEEKGLEYGYATFWNSQTITELSDSRVKCREVLATKNYGVYSDYYQSSRLWYTGQNYDRYFVLLSDSEYSAVRQTASWTEWTAGYLVAEYTPDDGVYPGFMVFVFSENVLDIRKSD